MAGRLAKFRSGTGRSRVDPSATVAVTRDDCGIVLLASPDGERFRTVSRLAMTASEARALYEASTASTLTAADLRHLYGDCIAKLILGSA